MRRVILGRCSGNDEHGMIECGNETHGKRIIRVGFRRAVQVFNRRGA
jgi:hypothetical protein